MQAPAGLVVDRKRLWMPFFRLEMGRAEVAQHVQHSGPRRPVDLATLQLQRLTGIHSRSHRMLDEGVDQITGQGRVPERLNALGLVQEHRAGVKRRLQPTELVLHPL